MIKSKREQELELEVKRLKKENEVLKKTVMIQQRKLKQKDELLADYEKENKIPQYNEAIRKNELLKEQLKNKEKELDEKNVVIQNLSTRLQKDSANSSKPSSTDSIYKKKVKIGSSKKVGGKNGGQWEHKGTTFSKEYVEELIEKSKTDKKIKYKVKHVGNKKSEKYKSKYEIDIEVVTTVTEYRYYENEEGKYDIPRNKQAVVKYGNNSKALMCYFTTEMMAPLNKIRSFFQKITNGAFKLSEGTIVNAQKTLDKSLTPVVVEIKEELIKAQ